MIIFKVIVFFAICLLPLPTPARPTTRLLVASENSPTRMDVSLFFSIIFSLALLFALLGSFTWIATGRTILHLFAHLNRIYHAFIAFSQRLSEFRFSSLVERAAATILNTTDANAANSRRRGGASYPFATVRQAPVQSGGFRGAQGGGGLPPFAPSTAPRTFGG